MLCATSTCHKTYIQLNHYFTFLFAHPSHIPKPYHRSLYLTVPTWSFDSNQWGPRCKFLHLKNSPWVAARRAGSDHTEVTQGSHRGHTEVTQRSRLVVAHGTALVLFSRNTETNWFSRKRMRLLVHWWSHGTYRHTFASLFPLGGRSIFSSSSLSAAALRQEDLGNMKIDAEGRRPCVG